MFQEYEQLTSRELAVIARVAAGQGNKAIAAEFDLSLHTVKGYVKSALQKTGSANRTDLATNYLRWLASRGNPLEGVPSKESPRKRE